MLTGKYKCKLCNAIIEDNPGLLDEHLINVHKIPVYELCQSTDWDTEAVYSVFYTQNITETGSTIELPCSVGDLINGAKVVGIAYDIAAEDIEKIELAGTDISFIPCKLVFLQHEDRIEAASFDKIKELQMQANNECV